MRILRLLEERKCGYVPRLLEADPETLSLVTTNCGQMAQKMRKQKIDRLFAELERDYGVRHDDPFEKNITYRQSDGRFCIIDFELAEETLARVPNARRYVTNEVGIQAWSTHSCALTLSLLLRARSFASICTMAFAKMVAPFSQSWST